MIDPVKIKEKLNPLHLEDLNNPEHPSVYDSSGDHYEVLILRLVECHAEGVKYRSHPYLILENIFCRCESSQEDGMVELDGTYRGLYGDINTRVDRAMRCVRHYAREVESIEEDVYDRTQSKHFINDWFRLKKDLLRFERIFARSLETIIEFTAAHKKNPGFKEIGFKDTREHLDRTHRLCQTHLHKLDTIYSFYDTVSNEKMNRTLYALTVISAIFLPLNLVVGFFGMNTEGMFFAGDASGTLYVVGVLLFISFFFAFLFPWIKSVETRRIRARLKQGLRFTPKRK